MMNLRLAKSHMENEEGMNHLLIKIVPPAHLMKQLSIFIDLPEGIHRLPNLNGFRDEHGWIHIDHVPSQINLLIEIYTTSSIPCGDCLLRTVVIFKQHNQEPSRMHAFLRLPIVSEDAMDQVVIDEEVVSLVKNKLSEQSDGHSGKGGNYVIIHPKLHELSNELSDLERKYRINF
jgi:hypothetical protein